MIETFFSLFAKGVVADDGIVLFRLRDFDVDQFVGINTIFCKLISADPSADKVCIDVGWSRGWRLAENVCDATYGCRGM
jgi:hypothetical protein